MRTITLPIYQFDELTPKAKEKARDWYRSCIDTMDFQDVVDSIKLAAHYLGFGNANVPAQLSWSVGYCQSDFARIEGWWLAKRVQITALNLEFPKDEQLHKVADRFESITRDFPDVYASTHGDRVIDLFDMGGDFAYAMLYDAIKAFNAWALRTLIAHSDWLHSNESVDSNILANEYEFTADGSRYE